MTLREHFSVDRDSKNFDGSEYALGNSVNPLEQENSYTVGSLFAGIGGIDLAFKNAGFTVEWANEIDKRACYTYASNFKHKIICDDIRNLNVNDLKSVDILVAGFPCQAFSIAGHQKGFEDERGSIFFDLMHIVRHIKPRVLFLENVKNIKTHNQGQTFQSIVNTIETEGYHVGHKVMNTCEYSTIPQNRERVYIVCFRDEIDYSGFSFPDKSKRRLSIQDIVDKKVEDGFYYNKTRYYEKLKEFIKSRETCYQWRRQYVRENKSNLCPTLTANMGTGGHNVPLILDDKDIRKLTPRECARFQGFSDTFVLPDDLPRSALYKQIGNSVSVPVVEIIAKQISKALGTKQVSTL